MRGKRAAISLGVLLACCPSASALNPSLDINQYAHAAWRVREGFSTGTIHRVVQTPDGYLWLATEFGLRRFDGVRSVPWPSPAADRLPDSDIRSLLAARDGTLWIGTAKGLASWKNGKLTQYPGMAGRDVVALLEDREGTVWAGAWGLPSGSPSGKLCAIRGESARCYGDDGTLGEGVPSLYEDSRGTLWVGAANGLWRWKPGPPKLYTAPGVHPEVMAVIEGGNGALLMATRGGIKQLVDGQIGDYPIPAAPRQFDAVWLLRDRDGGLWIGTTDLGLLHQHQGRTDLFALSDGLSADDVQSVFEDREGNIWVPTVGGIDRFHDHTVLTLSVKQGLSNAGIWSVLAARDGSVWLGTYAGLNRWKDGKLTIYRSIGAAGGSTCPSATGQGACPTEIVDRGLPDDGSDTLFEDDRGRIWVGTQHGLAYFEGGRFHPVDGVPGGFMNSIVEDRAGDLWISEQHEGLFHLHDTRLIEQVGWDRLGRHGSQTVLLPDPVGGGLWTGSWLYGVAYFKDGAFRASYGESEGLGRGRVNALQLDRDGTLWAATQGGLSRVKNGQITTLTSRNGLPCDRVHEIVEDDDHAFWLYMSCGLVRIERPDLNAWVADSSRTVRVTALGSSEGMRSHAGTYSFGPRVAKTKDGRLWFLPLDGVSVIDPHHLPFNDLRPPVYIEQVKADGKTYDASRGLRLPALVRDVWIDYTALSFVAPEKVRFRYRLEGQDPDWKEVVNDRQVQYTNLKPRHYRFRVMACNNSGVWNEAGDSLDFSVDPAYYQTRWFQASCMAAFLALLWALYRYRLHQIAHEYNARLEERVGERTRIARELHDTLLQSFQGLMLRLQVGINLLPVRPVEAKEALDKALDRADQAIAEGRDAVHDLRDSTVVTNDLAEALKALGAELASQDCASFRVLVEGPPRNLHPILRDEIYRIAREAMRNAFRHAHASRIDAEITYGEKALRLRIRDDGRGIEAALVEQGRAGHYGLPGMRERAKRIGAQLNIRSGNGTGTEIELSIPGSIAYGTSPGRISWWQRFHPGQHRLKSVSHDKEEL